MFWYMFENWFATIGCSQGASNHNAHVKKKCHLHTHSFITIKPQCSMAVSLQKQPAASISMCPVYGGGGQKHDEGNSE